MHATKRKPFVEIVCTDLNGAEDSSIMSRETRWQLALQYHEYKTQGEKQDIAMGHDGERKIERMDVIY